MCVCVCVCVSMCVGVLLLLRINMTADVNKKQNHETQSLLKREAQFTQFTHKDLHTNKEAGRERLSNTLTGQHKLKEVTKKYMKTE